MLLHNSNRYPVRRHRKVPPAALAALLAISMLATSCANRSEVVATDAAANVTKSPRWVVAGLRIADTATAATTDGAASGSGGARTTAGSALPSEAEFEAGLASAGISSTAAACIYDAIAADPTAATLAPQITALTDGLRKGGSDIAVDPASLQPLLVTVAPCLDSATLLAMTSALGGGKAATGGTGGDGSFGSLLTTLLATASNGSGSGSPGLGGLGQLLQLDGSAASSQQIAVITKLLSDPGALIDIQNGQVDLAILKNLDLRSLSEEQARAILLIFANQLTTGQQGQLEQIANVTLDELQLNIDPDKLTNEQKGSLLLLVSPFISAGLRPLVNRAPDGRPADQIYVPQGLDLANVNPLLFINRDSAVGGLTAQGLDAQLGGCLYDRLRLLDPQVLGRALIGEDSTGTLQLLLSVLTCVVNQ